MKKYVISSIIFSIAIFGVFYAPQALMAEEGSIIVPQTSGSNEDETGSIVPIDDNSNTNDTGNIIPSNGGNNTNDTGNIVPSSAGSNADENGTTPTPPPPTPVPSSGGSSRSSGGSSVIIPQTVVIPNIISCPLITTFMKRGSNNNTVEVTKLQVFLRNSQGLDVDVNGVFDQKTEDAVKAFQVKYMTDIMGPWDSTRASGIVYITTSKKINQLACAEPLTFSAEELAVVETYRSRLASGLIGPDGITVISPIGNGTATGTLDIGQTVDGSDNVAAAGKTSVLSRFWQFIKNLFTRNK